MPDTDTSCWWKRKPAPSIRDVPCLSCQHGYGRPHVCEVPEFCACDQWRDLHITPSRGPMPGGGAP